jgi:hypothetical protein
LLREAAGGQFAAGSNNPPPGQATGPGHDVADRARRSGIPGPSGDVAIAGDLAALEIPHDGDDRFGE